MVNFLKVVLVQQQH